MLELDLLFTLDDLGDRLLPVDEHLELEQSLRQGQILRRFCPRDLTIYHIDLYLRLMAKRHAAEEFVEFYFVPFILNLEQLFNL